MSKGSSSSSQAYSGSKANSSYSKGGGGSNNGARPGVNYGKNNLFNSSYDNFNNSLDVYLSPSNSLFNSTKFASAVYKFYAMPFSPVTIIESEEEKRKKKYNSSNYLDSLLENVLKKDYSKSSSDLSKVFNA